MDFNVLIGLAITGAGTVVWWLFRTVHSRVESAEKALAEFRLHCAETFVTSNTLEKALDNLNKTIAAVFAKLERIEDKLDLKADK